MAVNCVRWADREGKQSCSGWGDDPRPEQGWCPSHGLDGCDEWVDIDLSLTADVVWATVSEEDLAVITDATAVIRTNPSGRVPR